MSMRKSIFWKIFLALIIIMIVTLTFSVDVMYTNYSKEIKAQVKSEALIVKGALDTYDSDTDTYLENIGKSSSVRITYIDSDGTVIYDNWADASTMENHLQRPEIAAALSSGSGESTRHSDTISQDIYYYAIKLDSGNFIRTASTTRSLFGMAGSAVIWGLYLTLFIVIIGIIISNIISLSVTKPINQLSLDEPLSNKTYDELSPLLTRIDSQKRELDNKIKDISSKQRDFDYITSEMSEGLVILNYAGLILSANKAAKQIFGNDSPADSISLCRKPEFTHLVYECLEGHASNITLNIDGKIYDISGTPVNYDEKGKSGAIIFAKDITAEENAEHMRQEFSSNVSHELKTPLTSIMGASELISNGVAKPEDVKKFALKINSEAQRLFTLINDIIKLSQLDETDLRDKFTTCDIGSITQECVSQLTDKAEKNSVSLSLDTMSSDIQGFEPVLHEMIFNICDNAISYNKPGGSVKVTVKDSADEAEITVEDTGIGIPKEDLPHIFERFYRVDKSRSKNSGGTGLGLSIVKHGAILHNAKVDVSSRMDIGTTIKITFPKTTDSNKQDI